MAGINKAVAGPPVQATIFFLMILFNFCLGQDFRSNRTGSFVLMKMAKAFSVFLYLFEAGTWTILKNFKEHQKKTKDNLYLLPQGTGFKKKKGNRTTTISFQTST